MSGGSSQRGFSSAGRHLPLVLCLLSVTGCWTAPRAYVKPADNQAGAWIEGLSPCRPELPQEVVLDPTRPVTVLVHGCSFSEGGFRTLAEVFEAHGQQTICFNYNDRDRLETSSARLIRALEELQDRLSPGQLTVVGHSQGGLVSRRALIRERDRPVQVREGFQLRLVTVSAPFSGISASSHCGLGWLHAVTLGVTVGVCQAVAGTKWLEIPPGSEFMVQPGQLEAAVASHLSVVTDERGTCRRRDPGGGCLESDYVFALQEQYNPAVDRAPRVAVVEVQAGHVEIVGEQGTAPHKLLQVLQAHQILAPTPSERKAEIAALLARLYAAPLTR